MPHREKDWIATIDPARPVLLAGPTASGKSSLALRLAERTGGPIVNADALQVFSDWRILTARPSVADELKHPHHLYGHVPGTTDYSVGHWLREVAPFLSGPAPIIVGGTGLYFTALTEGLAEIPPTPQDIRSEAMRRLEAEGPSALLAELDAMTAERIDRNNPMRIQRAWEVLTTTGKGLAAWQDETPAPALPLDETQAIVLNAPKDWLTPRIEQRFDLMIDGGALNEARANAPRWSPGAPSAKAIGAAELVAVTRSEMSLEAAREAAITKTRQYAKRQRSWFRARMREWRWIDAGTLDPTTYVSV